jgi:ABC-type glutathione transport system ATPase component
MFVGPGQASRRCRINYEKRKPPNSTNKANFLLFTSFFTLHSLLFHHGLVESHHKTKGFYADQLAHKRRHNAAKMSTSAEDVVPTPSTNAAAQPLVTTLEANMSSPAEDIVPAPSTDAAAAPLLQWRDVTVKTRNGDSITTILHNVYGELHEGKSMCIMGPSGCGKTSLLK